VAQVQRGFQLASGCRGVEIPEERLLRDLVWSGPNPELDDCGDNDRGTSVCFGRSQVDAFLDKFGFDLICRDHQAVMEGFEFPFHPNQSLITLFSAPNYCYEFDKKGAILHVDERLFCSFAQLEPRKYPLGEDLNPGPRGGASPRTGSGAAPTAVNLSAELAGPVENDGNSDSSSQEDEGGVPPVVLGRKRRMPQTLMFVTSVHSTGRQPNGNHFRSMDVYG
jgi:hypothetical protein